MVTRQSAEVENNSVSSIIVLTGELIPLVNAVERLQWYTDKSSLPQEPPHEVPETQPADSWPEQGAISFNKIVMSYRKGLPSVLKGM
jgi:hypothetical protein